MKKGKKSRQKKYRSRIMSPSDLRRVNSSKHGRTDGFNTDDDIKDLSIGFGAKGEVLETRLEMHIFIEGDSWMRRKNLSAPLLLVIEPMTSVPITSSGALPLAEL